MKMKQKVKQMSNDTNIGRTKLDCQLPIEKALKHTRVEVTNCMVAQGNLLDLLSNCNHLRNTTAHHLGAHEIDKGDLSTLNTLAFPKMNMNSTCAINIDNFSDKVRKQVLIHILVLPIKKIYYVLINLLGFFRTALKMCIPLPVIRSVSK